VGGIVDDEWTAHYTRLGAAFILGGGDQQFLYSGAVARYKFLSGLKLGGGK
jgi:hypothetical protein